MIVSDSMERARGYLQGGQADVVNRLEVGYTPGDPTLQLAYSPDGLSRGGVISAGLACFMVWDVDASTRIVTVTPAWQGAQDVAVPIDTIVRVKPRYLDHMLYEAVSEAVTELSSPDIGLYAVGQVETLFINSTSVYDLTGAEDLEQVLTVSIINPDDVTDRWPILRESQYELRRIVPTAEFPSGLQLRINYPVQDYVGTTIVVTYKTAFTLPTDTTDDLVTNLGIPASAVDLPALGAAQRLAYSQEAKRTSTHAQGDARRAQEVPAGSSLGASRAISALYRTRCQQEYARLVSKHGIRQR